MIENVTLANRKISKCGEDFLQLILKGTGPVQLPNSGQIFTFGNYFEHRSHGMGRLSGSVNVFFHGKTC